MWCPWMLRRHHTGLAWAPSKWQLNMLVFNTSFEVSMGSPLASNPIKHLCCDDGRMKTGNQNPQRQVRASTLESCSTGLEKQSKKVGSPKNQLCRFPDKKSFLCCQWQLLFRRILFCSCKWKEPCGSQPAAQLLNLPMKTLRKRGKFARKQLCETARHTMCPLCAT